MMGSSRNLGRAALIAVLVLLPLFAAVRLGPQIRFNWGADQYDVLWATYVGGLVDQGLDPYDPQDHPELRDEEFEWNNAWLPPANLVLLGGVRSAAEVLQPGVEPVVAVSRVFAVFDALVGALFFFLLYAMSKMSMARSAVVASLWYGLNPLVITSNVFTPEDKPIYALMILGLFYVLWRLERAAEDVGGRYGSMWFVAACVGVGLSGGYRVVTLSLLPLLFVWALTAPHLRRWRTLIGGLGALAVALALTLLPYFPNSLEFFGVRTESLATTPTAASIWQWLPTFSVGLAGSSVGLPTILAAAGIAVILGLVWWRKASLTVAAGLTLLMVTVVMSVDGSLDRAMLAWTPLVLVLATIRPRLMTAAGLLAVCIAAPIAYNSMHATYNEPLEALYSIGLLVFFLVVSAAVISRPTAVEIAATKSVREG
jgi:hypothetical protein